MAVLPVLIFVLPSSFDSGAGCSVLFFCFVFLDFSIAVLTALFCLFMYFSFRQPTSCVG